MLNRNIDGQNIQQNIYLPTCSFNFTTNVGTAEIFGTEWEVLYQPIADLKLGVNGSLERARIVGSRNPQTAPIDSKIIFVPDWTLGI